MEVIKLQRQIVMHAAVVFDVNSDGPSTQLLQDCLGTKLFLSEPEFNGELELCFRQTLLYLQQHNTGSVCQTRSVIINWVSATPITKSVYSAT